SENFKRFVPNAVDWTLRQPGHRGKFGQSSSLDASSNQRFTARRSGPVSPHWREPKAILPRASRAIKREAFGVPPRSPELTSRSVHASYAAPRYGEAMTYSDAVQFLYGLRLFGTKLGLDN